MRNITPWAILLLTAALLLIAPATAETINYDFSDSTQISYTFSGKGPLQKSYEINRLYMYHIEDWTNPFTIVSSRPIETYFSPSEQPSAPSTSFSVTLIDAVTGVQYGSGEWGYNAHYVDGVITSYVYWLDVTQWDNCGATGNKYININGEGPFLETYGYTTEGIGPDKPVNYYFAGMYLDCGPILLTRYNDWHNSLSGEITGSIYTGSTSQFNITRTVSGTNYPSTIRIWDDNGYTYYNDYATTNATYNVVGEPIYTAIYSPISELWYNATWFSDEPTPTPTQGPSSGYFSLSLSPLSAAVGDPITATLTNIPAESSRLILNVNGIIHRDITNPYNFSAIGNSGETIYVFANCYDSSNNLLYSSNVVSYTLTGELEPIEPYPELETVEITGVAPSYTQGNTLSASLDDNDIIGINEICWKIIAQTDSNGNPSTITSKRYEFKEITSGNWQLKSGSSYTGSYTYANVKNLSHYIDGYGRFDVEVNCYNSTNGLIAIDRVNSYANPASYIKPVSVYIYGNSGLYSGEITLTTEYIVQSKNTTYYIYNGYDTINVVKAGDYNIYVDLTDNSIYKDKVLQYCYDSDGNILRVFLEEDYTISEHAKLSIRVVDSSGNPLSFANVHFIGLAESSMTTNANGYAEYIGINNETVKFTASKNGYITGEGSITLSDSINSFTLVLPTLTETITPTETSTSPDEDGGYNPFTNFITAIMEFGFNEEYAKIVVALGLVGFLFACGVKFGESTGAGLAGAVIGVIFSALLSLIPMWVIMAIILSAAAILATKFYADR